MNTTSKQALAALEAAAAIFEAIAAHGERGVPSGVLYAHTMHVWPDVSTYESCVALLERGNLIRRDGYLLYANTPKGR